MTRTILGVAAAAVIGCLGLPTLLLASVMGGPGGCGIAAPLSPVTRTASGSPHPYPAQTGDTLQHGTPPANIPTGCAVDALTVLPDDFTLPPDTAPAVAAAVFWAVGQLGTPYHFGGSCTDPHSSDPDKRCDCSSLMQAAYRAAGVSVPRLTTDQIAAGKKITEPALLLPGDLVFIPGSEGTMSRPRHVGMYLGQGLIIQAPKTGDVVKITRLNSWLNQIAAIRRIVK